MSHSQHEAPAAGDATATATAGKLGRDAGKAAASWIFDGSTPEGTYRCVLRGIEDGDPLIMDAYQAPGLSAATGYTETGLADDLGLDAGDEDRAAYERWRRKDPRGPRVEHATWDREVATVNGFFAWALGQGYVDTSPIVQRPGRAAGRWPGARQPGAVPAESSHTGLDAGF